MNKKLLKKIIKQSVAEWNESLSTYSKNISNADMKEEKEITLRNRIDEIAYEEHFEVDSFEFIDYVNKNIKIICK